MRSNIKYANILIIASKNATNVEYVIDGVEVL